MNSEKIIVMDDQGNEIEFTILFTFTNDETGRSYVLYYDETEENPAVTASIYDDEGNLFPIETAEEWDMISDVFDSFVSQDGEGGCCCGGDCDCDCDDDHECCGENGHECCCNK